MARSYKTEAVVLRSFRFGEADRVLHVYTLDRGRIGAVAKGVRKTKSRFGARLEPLSHVELLLHQGSGELHTVTGASLIDPHRPAREDPYRLSVGLVGAEAMLRLFVEQERNERAFEALTRFLTVLDELPAGLRGRGGLDPLALGFQLKLLWLSGYLPQLEGCVQCGATDGLVGYLPSAGGAVCSACAPTETVELTPEGFRGVRALVYTPLAEAHGLGLGERAVRDALAVVVTSYEYHGGVSPPNALRVRKDLGDGYELDDDPARIDREAVHRYLSEDSYWARGRARDVQDALIDTAARVVGVYHQDRQVGFTRTLSDGHTQSYLADVYVLDEHRGRGLGIELVRFSVDEGPFASTKWFLHTADAHDLYRKFGFAEPGERTLERWRRES